MRIIIYFFILILIKGCGNINTSNKKNSNQYSIIEMKINKKYEVNPKDIYLPLEENTELKIEYQLSTDKKFIQILKGKGILKKYLND